jgi:hypothetical protein
MVQKRSCLHLFPRLPNCPSKTCWVMTRYFDAAHAQMFLVRTQNLCLGIIHLFLKKTRAVQKFLYGLSNKDPFADFMPSFLGEVGPSFHSFIHSFIVQFLWYFLQRKTQMFLPMKVGSNFHPFSCTCCACKFATWSPS